jgi:signal transduction histidine kinase
MLTEAVVSWEERNDEESRFEDNGPGTPEEVLTHIFDPFYSARDHGAGVGLFLSNRFVGDHSSHIDAQNRPAPHHGASVTVWLPTS